MKSFTMVTTNEDVESQCNFRKLQISNEFRKLSWKVSFKLISNKSRRHHHNRVKNYAILIKELTLKSVFST